MGVFNHLKIPKIIRTPPTPSDYDGSPIRDAVIQHFFRREAVEIHSVHGLPLTIRQFEPPKRWIRGAVPRKIVTETPPGAEKMDIEQESTFPELYLRLQKRAVLRVNEQDVVSDEIIGVLHLDLGGVDYPIVEENWDQLKPHCCMASASFRFEFHVQSVVDPKPPGAVRKMLIDARQRARRAANTVFRACLG